MKERILYKLNSFIITFIFCVIIFIPFFKWIVQEDKITSQVEKRNLNPHPSLPTEIKEIIKYPKDFNEYYADHFGFREKLTKKYFKLVNKLSGKSSVNDVTIGQEGWLFLGSIKPGYTGYGDPIGDAININLFSKKELEEFAKSINTIKNWLEGKGIKYIYVIAPNKHTIYFEKLPKHISKQNTRSATDQLVEYLKKNTDVMVVDLRETLFEYKKKHQIYYKYDTHWNQYGANAAQFEILKNIKPLFPELIMPTLLNDNQFKVSVRKGGDLSEYAKMDVVSENNPQPIFKNTCRLVKEPPDAKFTEIHTTICDMRELNAVIFRDSFFETLKPYISRSFHRTTYIWEKINYNSLSKYVEQEKPHIVIDEVVERMLPYIPSNKDFPNSGD